MKTLHPDGKTAFYMQAGTQFMVCMDATEPGWITFGYLGGNQQLLISADEWPSFVALVLEVDKEIEK